MLCCFRAVADGVVVFCSLCWSSNLQDCMPVKPLGPLEPLELLCSGGHDCRIALCLCVVPFL